MNHKKINNLLKQAFVLAELSPDSQTQVASILVDPKSNAQLSVGYNGFCRSSSDDKLPKERPGKHKYILHAETNLIANAAKHGIATDQKVIVQTLSPCFQCCRLLYQSGISEVYFKNLYTIYDKIHEVYENRYLVELKDLTLDIEKTSDFYRMIIKPTTQIIYGEFEEK